MKLPYENELYELRKWIDFTNANLQMQFLHTPQEIQRVHQWINAITRGIQADYPFYATTLPCVANILFQQNEMGAIFLNPAAFGELVVIVRHIEAGQSCHLLRVKLTFRNLSRNVLPSTG